MFNTSGRLRTLRFNKYLVFCFILLFFTELPLETSKFQKNFVIFNILMDIFCSKFFSRDY